MPRILRRKVYKPYDLSRESSSSFRVSGYKQWRDSFGYVQGTLPEKMVYAELSKRGVPFYFQTEVDFNIPEIAIFKKYRPDFVLFQDKVIIEVQGAYFHSKPEAIESDAYKFAIYEMLGYKVIAWWDYQILRDLISLIVGTPEIMRYNYVGYGNTSEVVTDRKKTIDDSKGIRTMNYNRALRQRYKKKSVAVRRGRHGIL